MQKAFWQFGNLYTGKESVMGLPSYVVFVNGQWQGLLTGPQANELRELFEDHADWRPRDEAEKDGSWQQLIPFGVFKVGEKYAELKRGTEGSHSRLYQRYTLGIGGHVMRREYDESQSLEMWMEQKFHEELHYEGTVKVNFLGILNDNSDALGKNHLGLVYVLEGNVEEFKAKKHTESRLVKLSEMTEDDIGFLDRWSQMIYRQLRDREE